jgi:hypothetical protein
VLFYLIYGVARRLLQAFPGSSSVAALEIENAVLRPSARRPEEDGTASPPTD